MKIKDAIDLTVPIDVGSTREIYRHPYRRDRVIKFEPAGYYNQRERHWWKELKSQGFGEWIPYHYKLDSTMTVVEYLHRVTMKRVFIKDMMNSSIDLWEFNFMLSDDGCVKLADLGSESWTPRSFDKFCNKLNKYDPKKVYKCHQ